MKIRNIVSWLYAVHLLYYITYKDVNVWLPNMQGEGDEGAIVECPIIKHWPLFDTLLYTAKHNSLNMSYSL